MRFLFYILPFFYIEWLKTFLLFFLFYYHSDCALYKFIVVKYLVDIYFPF